MEVASQDVDYSRFMSPNASYLEEESKGDLLKKESMQSQIVISLTLLAINIMKFRKYRKQRDIIVQALA